MRALSRQENLSDSFTLGTGREMFSYNVLEILINAIMPQCLGKMHWLF
jgi:hypothetical protein